MTGTVNEEDLLAGLDALAGAPVASAAAPAPTPRTPSSPDAPRNRGERRGADKAARRSGGRGGPRRDEREEEGDNDEPLTAPVVAPTPAVDDDALPEDDDADDVDPATREPGTRKTDPTGTPVVTAKSDDIKPSVAVEPVTTTLAALAAVSALPKGTAAVVTLPAEPKAIVTPPTDAQLAGKRFCGTCGRDVSGLKFCPDDGASVDAPKVEAVAPVAKTTSTPAKAEVVTPAPVAPVAEWYVGFSKDDVQGPVTEEELTEAIKEGHIVAETQVHHPAIGWKSVAESPFASFLSTPATPAPAPPPPLRPQAPAPPPLPAAAPPVAQTPTATATPPAPPAFVPETRCGNPRCGVARFLPTDKRCRTPGCGYVFKVPS